MTVYEMLMYTAELKNSRRMPLAEKREKVGKECPAVVRIPRSLSMTACTHGCMPAATEGNAGAVLDHTHW